jgi:hypothetical protein
MSERAKRLLGTHNPDRWMAEIYYCDGSPPRIVAFEEIEHLDEIVEQGRDWNDIDRIVITLNQPSRKPIARPV